MPTLEEIKKAERKLTTQLRALRKARGSRSEADMMAAHRAAARDLEPRRVKNKKRRAACEHDDPRFLRTYLPDVFYNPFDSAQEDFINDCSRCLRFGTAKAKAMPRGRGKSSIVKYLQLKYALYRQLRFPLILAATATKAEQTLKDIKTKLRSPTNKALHEDFPFDADLARYVAPSPLRCRNATWGGLFVHVEWAQDRIILPTLRKYERRTRRAQAGGETVGGQFYKGGQFIPPQFDPEDFGLPIESGMGPIVMALGFTSDMLQGLNVYDIRPDFVMLDDLDSRDSLAAEHGVIAGKIERCLDQTVAGLGGPNRRLGKVFICTITSRRSAAYKYTNREAKPAWNGERIPAIVEWPKRKDLWEQYIDLRTRNRAEDPYGRAARDFLQEHFDEMHDGAVLTSEHDFNPDPLEDGEPEHLSALQKLYDYIADNGLDSFMTEHQNDPPEESRLFTVEVTPSHVLKCVGDRERCIVDPGTTMITRGVDIRKTEIHYAVLAAADARPHSIIDYDVKSHGTTETTVEQAEALILDNLNAIADAWDAQPYHDEDGIAYTADVTLIDKGWKGNWVGEDGTQEQWATQPVETFCMERPGRLRRWLPAKGAAPYTSPKPADDVIVGNHWHMNGGEGKERRCTEVIWDAVYWHLLVEELLMLSPGEGDRFEIFIPPLSGVWRNHRAFGEHITQGATQLKDQLATGKRSRRPRYVRDHWWDTAALMLVGQSVETWFRENLIPATRRAGPPRRPAAELEIGAR